MSRLKCGQKLTGRLVFPTVRHEIYPAPASQDAKPRVQPGFNPGSPPPPYIKNVVGELRVKPGVWRPEMWALIT
jgi:hypothetical protein